MDIVFEQNPRKKVDRAFVEAELARRAGLSHNTKDTISEEKTENIV